MSSCFNLFLIHIQYQFVFIVGKQHKLNQENLCLHGGPSSYQGALYELDAAALNLLDNVHDVMDLVFFHGTINMKSKNFNLYEDMDVTPKCADPVMCGSIFCGFFVKTGPSHLYHIMSPSGICEERCTLIFAQRGSITLQGGFKLSV